MTVVAPRGPGQGRRERVNGVEAIRFRLIDDSGQGAAAFVLE